MNLENLLDQLKNRTKIALQSSRLHGIGVFALVDIPVGTTGLFYSGKELWPRVPFEHIAMLPEYVRNLVETYCLFDDTHYFLPPHGFSLIDPVIYLNHSSTPNIISIRDGEDFETIRFIPVGSEILINYGTLADGLSNYN